ncbi:50S ribosomal protein L10 [Candidatus Gottesmanbacteria bacterium]|nr:50S ribosomal protein L10 [Candidatus Gottesmanbacteria bacterium]
MPNQRKINIVSDLADKLGKAKSFVLTDYRGLTHKQIEELKKSLQKAQAEFLVVKNTLLLRAMSNHQLPMTNDQLTGPTGVLFSYADEIAPLKILAKSIKSLSLPKIKLGYFDKKELSLSEVNRLITLPSKDVLLTQLAAQMKSPLFGLHRALSWNMQKLVFVLSSIKQKGVN